MTATAAAGTAAAGTAAAGTAAAIETSATTGARIRMYRQGLGDCFLLTFREGDRDRHVLIDCGVLTGTENARERMRKVAQSISDTCGKRLDVLVVTHEHWDHVSGFLQAEPVFAELEVGEIWLGWTEDPADSMARELATRKARALRAVQAAARRLAMAADPRAARSAARLEALLEFHGDFGVEGRPTTAKALEWVRNRTGATIRYCGPEDAPLRVPGVAGVRAYVLGPPRDPKLLRKSDPSKTHSEVYELAAGAADDLGFMAALAAADQDGGGGADGGAGVGGSEDGEAPFAQWFRLGEGESRRERFCAGRYWSENEAWRRIEHDWLETAGRLALQLDADTNNTSLVLAFELTASGRVLLFPGDAQVGSWLSWSQLAWKVADDKGGTKEVGMRDLLARTVLYKVGHHGSHNATLREQGLELMTSRELVALLPVERAIAKKKKWNMPLPSLFTRLREKTVGRIIDLEQGIAAEDLERLGGWKREEWERFVAQTEVQEDWIDYRIDF